MVESTVEIKGKGEARICHHRWIAAAGCWSERQWQRSVIVAVAVAVAVVWQGHREKRWKGVLVLNPSQYHTESD